MKCLFHFQVINQRFIVFKESEKKLLIKLREGVEKKTQF